MAFCCQCLTVENKPPKPSGMKLPSSKLLNSLLMLLQWGITVQGRVDVFVFSAGSSHCKQGIFLSPSLLLLEAQLVCPCLGRCEDPGLPR